MTAPELTFSVVICTLNRAALLTDALKSVGELEHPASDFEVLVVDNGSTDDTQGVVRRFAEGSPLTVRSVVEPERGLSAARNRGIREAKGRFVFFTDDDQLVHPHALREFQRVVSSYDARVVQGKIELLFPEGRPAWLEPPLTHMLGETVDAPEGPAQLDLYGGNMLLLRSLFDEGEGFRHDLGKGTSGWSEDVELSQRLKARGERVVYAPTARVFHVIGPDRTTLSFFRRTAFEKGYSDGITAPRRVGFAARALGSLALRSTLAVGARALGGRAAGLHSQTRALNRLGQLWGLIRRPD
ncbi:MAG: glycosyltransferase family 2 protein [Polyangiaceae bacterium]|nr:glycosyltransferase family 2 protein [Polyangiaceae bacterium]MCW5790293.1 glycosyltransferase family 2 protein [Polyangiaceae bacterium]